VVKAKHGYKKVKLFGRLDETPEDWKVNQFIDVVDDIKSGVSRLLSNYDIGYPILRSENIVDGKFDSSNVKYWYLIDNQCVDLTKYHLKPHDIILNFINSIAQIGKSCIFLKQNREWIYTTNVMRIKTNSKKISNYFFYYLLNSFYFKQQIIAITQPAVNQASFSKHWLEKLLVFLPKIKEQEKIASILNHIDNSIQKTTEQIEKTKQLKTGLMQKLLAKGIGHKKFKKVKYRFQREEKTPNLWKIISLKDISKQLVSGGTPDTETEEYWNGDIPWLRSAWLTNHYVIAGERKISKKGLENSSSKLILKNNLLISSRVSLGNISINKIDMAINQDVTGIILNKNITTEEFVYWILVKDMYRITSISQGTTIKGFTRGDLSKLRIPLPPIEEQQKITSILSNVDSKIEQLEKNKSSLEICKKGLMQKLLTGQIRVYV